MFHLFYQTTDTSVAMEIIEKYGVDYIYVGQLEWVNYPPEGLDKFNQMAAQGLLREVYRQDAVLIYEVIQPDTAVSEAGN